MPGSARYFHLLGGLTDGAVASAKHDLVYQAAAVPVATSHAWRLATETEQIILFDQGFLQALCSLVVLGGSVDKERIALAVALLPAPDMVIHLTAPVRVLEERLHERNAHQGRLERLLELDMRANLNFVPVIEGVCELLRLREQSILRADCTDDATLRTEVGRITRKVLMMGGSSMVAEA
jgi:hypothetical protein